MSDDAAPRPWPAGDGPVVFLGDVRNGLERALLADWLRSTAPSPGARVDLLDVALEGRPRRSAALRTVLSGQDETTLVPVRVAWLPERDARHSGPRLRDLLLGDPRQPRPPVARMVLRRDPDRVRYVAGAPATVAELRERHRRLAVDEHGEGFDDFVLRQAGIALDVAERTLQGRRYKVPRFVIAGIENSSGYKNASAHLAAELGRPVAEVRQEARRYLRELVATPSTFFIDWVGTLTRWITSLGYQDIVTDPDAIERTRRILRDHPAALLWTHKSHVDAIALMSVMYDNDFPAPHSIGGINMAFGGLGYAGRRSGTIYIRRTFHDLPVYKMALQQYLSYLMEKRFPLSWAFEGTRSRTGKLGRPRYGLLKYAVDAAHATGTENLHLVPVSISYDLIGETTDYAREESGQPKEAENLGWFLDYLRRLRAPMGNIYLDFAEPVVLDGPSPEATPELLRRLSFEVARRANAQVPVTLPALMCLALLGAAPRALTYAELDLSLRRLLAWLLRHDVRLAGSLERADVPELESLAESVFRGGVVQRVTEGSEPLFEIREDQYAVAGYYRNTIIHYFTDKAIAEAALLAAAAVDAPDRLERLRDEARWLRDLTTFELYHTPSPEFLAAVEAHLAAADPRWQEALTGSAHDVLSLLEHCTPLVAHATLLPFLEAYWIVAKVCTDLPGDKDVKEADIVAEALRLGDSMVRRRRVSSPASLGRGLFTGACSYLDDRGLLQPGDARVRSERLALVTRLEGTIRRVRRIGDAAQHQLVTNEEPPAAAG